MATTNLTPGVILGSCEEAHRPQCPEKQTHVHIGVTWSNSNWPVCSRAIILRLLQMLRISHCIKEPTALIAEEKVRRNEVVCIQHLSEDYTAEDLEWLKLLGDDGKSDLTTADIQMLRVTMDSMVFFTG
ncbi:MAG: hypothetical protein Q7K16_02395 [Candidatus Azambacteria bacterium]|nr:hypothetical protein [Candidatus Azambacteria bacterium]